MTSLQRIIKDGPFTFCGGLVVGQCPWVRVRVRILAEETKEEKKIVHKKTCEKKSKQAVCAPSLWTCSLSAILKQ